MAWFDAAHLQSALKYIFIRSISWFTCKTLPHYRAMKGNCRYTLARSHARVAPTRPSSPAFLSQHWLCSDGNGEKLIIYAQHMLLVCCSRKHQLTRGSSIIIPGAIKLVGVRDCVVVNKMKRWKDETENYLLVLLEEAVLSSWRHGAFMHTRLPIHSNWAD